MIFLSAPANKKVYVTWTVFLILIIVLSLFVPQSYNILPGATLAWVIIGVATAFTGSIVKSRRLGNYGFIATIAGVIVAVAVDFGLITLAFALIGFGLVIGLGLMLVGFTTRKTIVPLGAYMLIGAIIQYMSAPPVQFLVTLTWLMLGGAALASFGYLSDSPVAHFAGIGFIFGTLAVYILAGENYLMVGVVGISIVLGSLVASFTYMYHRLGRPPKVGEILTLAARALFTYGLRKPLDEYRVIAIAIQGDIGTELVIDELLSNLEERWRPIVLLGPTSPTEIILPSSAKLGWVSALSGVTEQSYTMLSPNNPSDVNIFIGDAVKETPSDQTPIIIGDFLDNIIPFMKEETFFRYYSDLASRIKVLNQTAVFIVKSDIHPEVTINIVKRFADVIIENREREERRQRVVREVRVSNKIDNFSTEWEKIPMTAGIHSRRRQE